AGSRVRLAGWVHRRRQLGAVSFVVLRDATGLAQVVATEPGDREFIARELTEETVVEVSGEAVPRPAAPGGVEVVSPTFRILATVVPPPFDLHRPVLKAALPTQLDQAPLSLRHPRRATALRVAAAAVAGFRAKIGRASGSAGG